MTDRHTQNVGSYQGERRAYRDVCLVDALRGHGYKCPYTSDGPFWALQDGNVFLKPFQCHVCRSDRLCHDEYAVYYSPRHHVDLRKCVHRINWQHIVKSDNAEFLVAANNHFMGIRKQDGCLEVNTSNRTHTWHKIYVDDLPSPLTYSVDLGCWRMNPSTCTGFFVIQDLWMGVQQRCAKLRLCRQCRFFIKGQVAGSQFAGSTHIILSEHMGVGIPVRKNYPCGRTQTTGAPAMLI